MPNNQPQIMPPNSNTPTIIYKPSEILDMIASYFAQQDVNKHVIFLQGIYLKNPKHSPAWRSRYDTLRDENTQSEITLQIPYSLADDLKDGSLVTVGGMLGRNLQKDGRIQIQLSVTRVEIIQDQAINEDEMKRMEIRREKAQKGFRNVDSILEQLLFIDKRPKVALIFATTSITMSDFNAGIQAARSAIDFEEHRVNFANSSELCQRLKDIDLAGFDVMALVRGGGGGIESLDDLDVLQTVSNLQTPIIAAVGHVEEKLFIKQIADKEAPTPNGLGQYFSEMVETVSEKKTRSRAVLTEQIKKQFKEQLEAGQKQNKELQEKLTNLTKNQEEATKKHNEQVQAAQKQNKELQDKLTLIQKANTEQQQKQNKAQTELQEQLKQQQKAADERAKELNASIQKMQQTNGELQKSLSAMTTQHTQDTKDLNTAKDQARELERQLNELKNKNGGNNIGAIIAAVVITAILTAIICLTII